MKKNYYSINSWIEEDEYFYFVPVDLNVLVKYSKRSECEEWMVALPEMTHGGESAFSDILKYENKIILTPLHEQNILIYDIERKEFEIVKIPLTNRTSPQWGRFSKAYVYGTNIYFLGYTYPGIVKLDMHTREGKLVWDATTIGENIAEKTNVFAIESVQVDNAICFLLSEPNAIVKFDMQSETVTYSILDATGEISYKTIAYDGMYFWMTQNGTNIVRCSYNLEEKNVINLQKEDVYINPEYRYSAILNNKLFVASSVESPILVVDCEEPYNTKHLWKDYGKEKGYSVEGFRIYNGEKDKIYFFNKETRRNCILDYENNYEKEFLLLKNGEMVINVLRNSGQQFFKEKNICLEDYIMYMVTM